MKKLYIGIDAHKDSNVIALAFAGKRVSPEKGQPVNCSIFSISRFCSREVAWSNPEMAREAFEKEKGTSQ